MGRSEISTCKRRLLERNATGTGQVIQVPLFGEGGYIGLCNFLLHLSLRQLLTSAPSNDKQFLK